MTSASGTYTYCGFGQPFALEFTCTGPNCEYLDGFPGTNCTSDGTTLTCTNGVVCPTSSNYTSTFTLDQPLNAITQTTQIFLSDACTEVQVSNNGTDSGVNVVSMPIANCTTAGSSSVAPSSLTSSTSRTSSIAPLTPSATSGSNSSETATSSLASSSTNVPSNSTILTKLSCASMGSSFPCRKESSILTSRTGATITGTSSVLPTSQPLAPSGAESISESVTSSEAPASAPSSAGESSSGNAATTSLPASNLSLSGSVASNTAVSAGNETPSATTSESAAASSTPTLSTASTVGLTSSISQPASSVPAQVYSSNARPWRKPGPMTTCYVIFVIVAMFQTTMALDITLRDVADAPSIDLKLAANDTSPNFAFGELMARGKGSLGKQFTDLIAEYIAGKITSPELADTFLGEIYNAICSHFAGLVVTTGIFAEVGQFVEYASLVFDTIALPTGPAGWLIAFSFTVALNVLVSEMFPQVDQIVSQACGQPKPCSKDFANDAKNCGRCGNMCASGVCKNSACVSNACTGETCSTFTACGQGGTCVCASTAEGSGFCVDGSTPCAGLQTCTTSGDCSAGEICGVATCCGINVCVGATFCGGANTTSTARFLFRREVDGPMVGYLY